MRFDLLHRLVTIGTLLTGLVSLVLSGEFGLAVTLPAFVVSIVGPFMWRLFDRKWLIPASGAVAVVAVVVAVAWAVASTDYLYAAIVFALFLTGMKSLFLRRAPDFMQMYALSFLMVMAAAVVNPGISFGVAMLPYVILLTLSMMLTTLRRGIEAQATDTVGATGPAIDESRLRASLGRRDLVRSGFLTATVGVTVGVFLISLVFFFLFPRLGLGFFAQQSRRGLAVTGFSDEVRLGDFGNIAEDPEVVLRVRLKKGGTGPLRMRGQSLDRYDGAAWRKTTAQRRQLRSDQDGRLRIDPGRDRSIIPGEVEQEIYLEPMQGALRVLFGLPQLAAFERPSSALEALKPAQWRFHADDAGDPSLTGPPAVAIVYTVYSDPRPFDAGLLRKAGSEYPAGIRDLYLSIPAQKAGVTEIARRVAEGTDNAYDLARGIESFLKDGYEYSLSSSHGDDDPLADFLLVNRQGHCEYFASAMVVLLRLAGVPARIVNGFYGGVTNRYGDYVALRRSDAHSWVEAYFPGLGWATFDPTPSAALDLRSSQSWWQGVSEAVDATKLAWYRWVVEYNLEKQIAVLASLFRLRKGADGFKDSLDRGDFKDIRDRVRGLPWTWIGLCFVGVIAGLTGIAFLRRRLRLTQVRRPLLPAGDDVLVAYLRMRRGLKRAGVAREPPETQIEFADRVAVACPGAADAVRAVTRAYIERAFGGVSRSPVADLEAKVDECLRALALNRPGRLDTPSNFVTLKNR